MGGLVVGACAGVGLWGGAVGRNCRVTAVERGRGALADSKVDLQGRVKAGTVESVSSPVERWRAAPAAVGIADPARAGLGRDAARTLLGCEPDLFVLVGCDPSAFARDAALLVAAGLELVRLVVVDLFPGTSHVETVGAFVRA